MGKRFKLGGSLEEMGVGINLCSSPMGGANGSAGQEMRGCCAVTALPETKSPQRHGAAADVSQNVPSAKIDQLFTRRTEEERVAPRSDVTVTVAGMIATPDCVKVYLFSETL